MLSDLDRVSGRLTVRRLHGVHTVFLDELTLGLVAARVRERARRWLRSTNPHLLVSQQTAVGLGNPPMSITGIRQLVTPLGISPRQLRVDRLLDEADHTADPVHLMRVFGVSTETAIKYVKTAHPERFAIDPVGD